MQKKGEKVDQETNPAPQQPPAGQYIPPQMAQQYYQYPQWYVGQTQPQVFPPNFYQPPMNFYPGLYPTPMPYYAVPHPQYQAIPLQPLDGSARTKDSPPKLSDREIRPNDYIQHKSVLSAPPKKQYPPTSNKPDKIKPNSKPQNAGNDQNPIDNKLSVLGLINKNYTTKEEIRKWVEARKRNFPSKRNLEAKKKMQEEGKIAGALNGEELSKLELKLRKKITILSGDFKEEKIREKELRYIQKNINFIRKRKPRRTAEIPGREGKRNRQNNHRNGKLKKQIKNEEKIETGILDKEGSKPLMEEEAAEGNDDEPPVEQKISKIDLEGPLPNDSVIKEGDQQQGGQSKNGQVGDAQTEQGDVQPKSDEQQPDQEARPVKVHPPRKVHTCEEIISHLKKKKEEDEDLLDSFLSDKPTASKFKYQQNALLASLLVEEVHHERSIMLQTLRLLKENNFLQDKEPHN